MACHKGETASMSYGHSFYFAYEIFSCIFFGGCGYFFTKNTLAKKGELWKQELH